MTESTSTPPEKPKRKLIVTCLADVAPTDYSKFAAIVPGAIRFQVAYYDQVVDTYDLPLNRCRNYKEILGWVNHLCTKRWMKPGLLRYFVKLACQANGVEMPWP